MGKVFYEDTLLSNQRNYKEKKYFGVVEESLKGCLYNHNLSFRNEFYGTELSKEHCKIKMKRYTLEICWKLSQNAYYIIITLENVIHV